jgi:hypothetical protein
MPEKFRQVASGKMTIPRTWEVTRADLALAAGEAARAEAGYIAMIATDPINIHAWAGLVVAVAATRSTHAWRILIRHPELVRDVYVRTQQLGARLSPIEVAERLDRRFRG